MEGPHARLVRATLADDELDLVILSADSASDHASKSVCFARSVSLTSTGNACLDARTRRAPCVRATGSTKGVARTVSKPRVYRAARRGVIAKRSR